MPERIYKTNRTYRWRDKDPVCDELRTMLQDVGLYNRLGHVAILSGRSLGTIKGIFHGETKRPQNNTIMSIATSAGFDRKWVRERKFNIEEELVIARAWNKKEKARVDKLRGK